VWIGDTDVGLTQVCDGYAWVDDRFLSEFSDAEQQAYRACEERARKERRGLWRDPRPTPPWEWRRSQRGAEEAR
jgi:endonuclease YncB( thermonuclease family)